MGDLLEALTGTYALGILDGLAAGAALALQMVANGLPVGEVAQDIDVWLCYRSEVGEMTYPVIAQVSAMREHDDVQRKD